MASGQEEEMSTIARGFLLHGPHHLLTPPLLKIGFSYLIPLEVF